MLDVHPPHAPTHTWRDFLLHIATIVIGLLIAVGLEQTVEMLHHQHQRDEARDRLLEEVKENGVTAADNVYAIRMHRKHLLQALQVLDRARRHALLPTDRILSARPWVPVKFAAWKTARGNGAASYLSPSEQSAFELANLDAQNFMINSAAASLNIGRAASVIAMDLFDRNAALPVPAKGVYYGHQGDTAAEEALTLRAAGPEQMARLTPSQIERLEEAIQSAIFDDQNLLNDCRHLSEQAEEIPKLIHPG